MQDVGHLAEVFSALASSTRLEIVAVLASSPAGAGVTEIARRVEISRFSASFHLDKLVAAGVISRHQAGTKLVHLLTSAAVDAIDDWVADLDYLESGSAAHSA